MTKVQKVCAICGSTQVLRDAYVEWNDYSQEWEIQNIFDDAYCVECDGSTYIEDSPLPELLLWENRHKEEI